MKDWKPSFMFLGILDGVLGIFNWELIRSWPDFFTGQLAVIMPGVSLFWVVTGFLMVSASGALMLTERRRRDRIEDGKHTH